MLANTGIGDRSTATGHFSARRSAQQLSKDTRHPNLSGLVPQNVTPDPQKGRHAGRKGNWRQFLRGVLGVPHSGRLSAGQVVAVIHPDAGPSATKRDVLWLAAGEWICLDQESIEAPVCTCGRVLE